jgi:hypothetical protein
MRSKSSRSRCCSRLEREYKARAACVQIKYSCGLTLFRKAESASKLSARDRFTGFHFIDPALHVCKPSGRIRLGKLLEKAFHIRALFRGKPFQFPFDLSEAHEQRLAKPRQVSKRGIGATYFLTASSSHRRSPAPALRDTRLRAGDA